MLLRIGFACDLVTDLFGFVSGILCGNLRTVANVFAHCLGPVDCFIGCGLRAVFSLVVGRLGARGCLVVGLLCSRRDSVSSVFGRILGVGSGGLHVLLGAILRNGKAGGEKD